MRYHLIIIFKNRFNNVAKYIFDKYLKANLKKEIYILNVDNYLLSLLTLFKIIFKTFFVKNLTLYLPLSNSRFVKLFLLIFKKSNFYSYSDGVGDCMYGQHLISKFRKEVYCGHFGNSSIYKQSQFDIDIKYYIESWVDKISYSKKGRILINFRIPFLRKKITTKEVVLLFKDKMSYDKKYIFSGSYQYFKNFKDYEIEYCDKFNNLNRKIIVSGLISFPSTIIIGFLSFMPLSKIFFINVSRRKFIIDNKDFNTCIATLLNVKRIIK